MHLAIKLLLWIVAGTGALLVALVGLLLLVDVNLYRDRIQQHVSNALGREVILEGDLALEPSLRPRFVVNGLKITNPDWASRPYLATVDKFDIRVSLLALLQGELDIQSLEFHAVDLLLEKNDSGADNFTFASSGEAGALPSIDHLLLHDATIAYAGHGAPVKRLHMAQVTARKTPGRLLELDAHTSLKAVPVTLSLRAEPQAVNQPDGPWQVALSGKAGDLAFEIDGSMANPSDWHRGEYRLDLEGRHLHDIEALSGLPLPEAEPVRLGANIRINLDDFVAIEDIVATLGSSDIRGKLHWDMASPRPAFTVQLASQELHGRDLDIIEAPAQTASQTDSHSATQPADMGRLAGIDLDAGLRVARWFPGEEMLVQDIDLTIHADQDQLALVLGRASVNDIPVGASATLPWGERLTDLSEGPVTTELLLQQVDLEARTLAADTLLRYELNLMGKPVPVALSSVEATARPGKALTLHGTATLNDRPATATLRGEPLATLAYQYAGPWQGLGLEVVSDDLRVDATGSIARPLEFEGIDTSFSMSGPDISRLLPLQGAWSASGRYANRLSGRHVIDRLRLSIGSSDISGRIALHQDGSTPRLVADLESGRLRIDELVQENPQQSSIADQLESPLEIGALSALDLELQARIDSLEGLAMPVKDLTVSAVANRRRLILEPVRATVDGAGLDAQITLPWGERLASGAGGVTSLRQLAAQADISMQAQFPPGRLRHDMLFMGQAKQLELAAVSAAVAAGDKPQIRATGRVDDAAVQINLQSEPLAAVLRHPQGPWQDLAVEILGSEMQLQATGSVEHPLEGRGFDIRYSVRGDRIESVLPIFDFVLPLEGAYSLTGHFADLPERRVFDKLQIMTGNTDISGDISIHEGKLRPRVVANFQSKQIYLTELLPVSDTEQAAGAKPRIIPDYNLPIERFRDIDGEMHFSGDRLRTEAGDLGEINFTATLEDGVFRLDPFRVSGWAGARVESTMSIDASREPPGIDWQWIARELNYGVLLQQAGLAETVEGTLDVSLRLAGEGRTRHEFLGNADGQLVIVGEQGRFGSRRLDLWGSSLITTMLSPQWRREDVTHLNCLVARINIQDGMAASDDLLVDTRRITIGAAGTLDLESEELNIVFAPRPKRATLVGITNPAHLTGTLSEPEVSVTVLPRNRMAAAGSGLLAGLINPAYLLFAFTQTGSGVSNPCQAAVNDALVMKGRADEIDELPAGPPPARFSILPGCARSGQRRE